MMIGRVETIETAALFRSDRILRRFLESCGDLLSPKLQYKYLDLARELKRTMEHEGVADTNDNWCARSNLEKLGKGTGRFRNQRTSGDHPD